MGGGNGVNGTVQQLDGKKETGHQRELKKEEIYTEGEQRKHLYDLTEGSKEIKNTNV